MPVQSLWAARFELTAFCGVGFGSADGIGSDARFFGPKAVAIDSAGNLFVADTENHTIRKIGSSGAVTTFAGLAGVPNTTDGKGTEARFRRPQGLAIDADDNIYVADTENCVIRKITRDGVVTTFAGQAGSMGQADGTGSLARFQSPTGIAVDASGNIYVADSGNNTIRKITKDRVVTTLAGSPGQSGYADGQGAEAKFSGPQGLVVDAQGNVFVADVYNSVIRKITPDGVVSGLAGAAGVFSYQNGNGRVAKFDMPQGLAIDRSGTLYVADSNNDIIRKVTSAGEVTTLAGSGAFSGSIDGDGDGARFAMPIGIACDSSGNLFVADYSSSIIRKVTSFGRVTTFAGRAAIGYADGTGSLASFYNPEGLALDSGGNLFIADNANQLIRKVTPDGTVSLYAGQPMYMGSDDQYRTASRFSGPTGIAIDRDDNLYVTCSYANTIRKITKVGNVSTLAGQHGVQGSADGLGNAAKFSYPSAIAVDGAGNVYVADEMNYTIRKITPAGLVTTLAGLAGTMGAVDGVGNAARFGSVSGLAVNDSGIVFVADCSNKAIRKITPEGVVTTFAGFMGNSGNVDGTGTAARFSEPLCMTIDAAGNLYVSDNSNYTIRMITPAGVVTTVAERSHQIYLSGVSGPLGIAVDGAGSLYLSDTNGQQILKGARIPTTPEITEQPANKYAWIGGTLSLTVKASGAPTLQYQWYKDGKAISSATGASLDIVSVSNADAGTYLVNVTNSYGTVSSSSCVVTVTEKQTMITALSVRAPAGTGEQTMIIGVLLAGSGGKPMILRGIGPNLSGMLSDYMRDPKITLQTLGGVTVAENDNWVDSDLLRQSFAHIGMALLPQGSKDAALVQTLTESGYVMLVESANASPGIALAEVYDAAPEAANQRLSAVSVRNQVGVDDNILIAGVIISGDAPKRVILRGIGPGMSASVASYLRDPILEIHNAVTGQLLGSNDNWQDDPATGPAMAKKGFDPLPSGSKDAAMVVELQPGAYSISLSGKDRGTGVGMIEVYEAD